jgi:hypothetical protein
LKNLVLLCFGRKEKNRLRGFIINIPQKQKPCKAGGQAGQLGYMFFLYLMGFKVWLITPSGIFWS